MYNPMDLTGKRVLVTGAGGGIGAETARVISALGGSPVLMDVNEGLLTAVRASDGTPFPGYAVDLTDVDGLSDLMDRVCAENGMFHGFVHCAGIAPMRPFKMTKYENVLPVMQINFFSFVEIVRLLTMKKGRFADGGSIVAMSSMASVHGKPTKTAYSASKAAVDSAIRCMICDLSHRKIRINSVMPSWVNTSMYRKFCEKYPDSKEFREIEERQYMGVTEPNEVANTIAFLLSDAAITITGTSILMDGGILQG